MSDRPPTGARLIALALHGLGVRVVFGLVGIPVVQVAEECLRLGVRFLGFRNEQACGYAATAYGYLTGRPGVCLVVGGPGVLHAVAGVGNAAANAWPLLLLAGSSESHLLTKGAFQEMDAVALLAPHVKLAVRAAAPAGVAPRLAAAYRAAWYGRPGTGFVDLPADVIEGEAEGDEGVVAAAGAAAMAAAPRCGADPDRVEAVADLVAAAKAPLIVVGKGAAYARAEAALRKLVDETQIPFLPTPMGKGVLPDSHALNAASARSAALAGADVVVVFGARLNWILHFGEEPKWSAAVTLVQVDICAEEIGRNAGAAELGLVGDARVVAAQLGAALRRRGFRHDAAGSAYVARIRASEAKNAASAAQAAASDKIPMTYARTFGVIRDVLQALSAPAAGGVVFVSEGANTMDISRGVFAVEHPRLRLDAGTYATMGVGLGYAIAAHAAYNLPAPEGASGPAATGRKKIVCLEGDSAFGFSMAEVETMARYGMDILVFVINNSGVYHGDSDDADEWLRLQRASLEGGSSSSSSSNGGGLRSTSLGYQVAYEKMAEMCGGRGFVVRTPEELARATEEGFKARVPVVVNVIIEAGSAKKLEFAWQKSTRKGSKSS